MLIPLATSFLFSVQPYLAVDDSELHWNIARDLSGTHTPNILSELEFKSVTTRQIGLSGEASAEWRGPWQILLEGEASYSQVDRGTTVDSDYFGNDRTALYSRSRSNVVGDRGFNLQSGVGLNYDLVPGRNNLAFLIGVYRQEQRLNFQRGTQAVADPNVFTASTLDNVTAQLQQLDTDYASEWQVNQSRFGLTYRW